jgi:two-component system CheB/CheR fusion protein
MRVLPYKDDGRLDGVIITFFEVTEIVAAERQQKLLVQELNHRVRNMLAVVTVIARQTARQATPGDFAAAFIGRIEALARAYGLVAQEQWGDVPLREVVNAELEPHIFDNEARFKIKGPQVLMRPKAALALGLVLHELATNAAKYGALSDADGSLEIEWSIEQRQDGRRLAISWTESGGPPAREPDTTGFGSVMIEREIRHELSGEVVSHYRPEGLKVEMRVPWREELLG